jgi:hypothetical protein
MSGLMGRVGVGEGMILNDVAVGVSAGEVEVGNVGINVAVGIVTEAVHALKLSERINKINKLSVLLRFMLVSIPLTPRFECMFQPVC